MQQTGQQQRQQRYTGGKQRTHLQKDGSAHYTECGAAQLCAPGGCSLAGGAARAICVELALAGAAHITIVSRPGPNNLGPSLLEILQTKTSVNAETNDWVGTYTIPAGTDIVVNATSVGLYPNVDAIPNFDLDSLTSDMFVQDVIPNPTETALIKELRRRGIRCETGAGMLINQAALNIEMWTGRKPDKAVMYKALEEALS